MKLLFDEMVSHHVVKFLGAQSRLGEMKHVRDMNLAGEPDHEWIPIISERGFILISSDRNDATRGLTVQDMKVIGARAILIGSHFDHMTGWQRAKWLVNSIESMVLLAASMPSGSVVLLSRNRKRTYL